MKKLKQVPTRYKTMSYHSIRFLYRSAAYEKRSAAVAVEFGLVAPIIVLLFFAAIEFVRFNLVCHTANNAAYEAARHVIVPGASRAEAEERAKSILSLLAIQDATISITPAKITEETPAVQVSIAIPVASNGWVSAQFFSNRTLQVTSVLRTERAPIVQAGSLPEPPPPPPPVVTPPPAPQPNPAPNPAPNPTPKPPANNKPPKAEAPKKPSNPPKPSPPPKPPKPKAPPAPPRVGL